jgi:hypothetical protein
VDVVDEDAGFVGEGGGGGLSESSGCGGVDFWGIVC